MSSYKLLSDDLDDTASYGSVASSEEKPDNPFADDDTAEHWRQVYERCQYECKDVFDPKLTWSAEEERRLVRKLDGRVCLWAVR